MDAEDDAAVGSKTDADLLCGFPVVNLTFELFGVEAAAWHPEFWTTKEDDLW